MPDTTAEPYRPARPRNTCQWNQSVKYDVFISTYPVGSKQREILPLSQRHNQLDRA